GISTHREYPGSLLPSQPSGSCYPSLPPFTIGKAFVTIVWHTRKHQLLRQHITADRTPPTAATAAAAAAVSFSIANYSIQLLSLQPKYQQERRDSLDDEEDRQK
ncbi:unnamed protein product, partial [Ectocarpus sp. 4 AP-2014]